MIVSLFIVSRGLELSGILGRFANVIVKISGESEFKLLSLLVLIVSLSSAVIMNDTAMFVFVPFVLTISKIADIDLPKAVSSVALAANIGSALTPIGNPQNIIIWRTFKIPLQEFVRLMFPYFLLWLTLLIFLVWIGGRCRRLKISPMPKIKIKMGLMVCSISLLIVNVALAERNLAYVGFIITLFVMAIVGREALYSLDIALIAVFALIFIDFKEMSSLLFRYVRFERSATKIILLSAGLSQLISNVPTTVMLISQRFPWLPLAIGVNIGGTGIVIGSLANFIATRISGISLKDFHKYSLPYFLTALSLTLAIINFRT